VIKVNYSNKPNTFTGIWIPFGMGLGFLFIVLRIFNLVLDNYTLHIITVIGIYIIAATSLNLTNGYTGLFSLGHTGFMLIGAYTSVLLTYKVSLRTAYNLPSLPTLLGGANYQWPFLPALLMGGVIAAIIMIIVTTMAKAMKSFTRGASGIQVIPHYSNLWNVYIWVAITIFVLWRILALEDTTICSRQSHVGH